MKTIHTNRTEVLEASEYIYNNIAKAYLGTKGGTDYYNVNGIIWEVWHSGCGSFPTSNNVSVNDFNL